MMENLFDVQNQLTYLQLCDYRDSFKNKEYFDDWGDLQVWLPVRINGIMYGAEINLCCDSGEDCTAYYLMMDDGEYATSDHSIFEHYDGIDIVKEFALDTMNDGIIHQMCKFVLAIIETKLNNMLYKGTFIGDPEKMLDYYIMTKDEFLKSYSYLTEDEYDATKTYLNFLNSFNK